MQRKGVLVLLALAGTLAFLSLASQALGDWTSDTDPYYPYYPSPDMTPGDVQETDSSQFCQSGWSSAHRHVTSSQYRQVYGAYGIPYPQPTGTFELDHFIPLELGGANTNYNLWPQPRDTDYGLGFHEKDNLENELHHLVCTGQLDTDTAVYSVVSDWIGAWCTYVYPC
jgi:hypothetical protein